jgi:sec-independent protein translocase protein TatC
MLPVAWRFFLGFQSEGGPDTLPVQLEARVGEYISLVMKLIFAFGLCFQMPVLLTLLTRVGIISSETLSSKRRYAIVIVFIIAAIVTPPDPISQLSLALPMVLLYEVSVWLSKWVERKREQAEKEAELAAGSQSVSEHPAE